MPESIEAIEFRLQQAELLRDRRAVESRDAQTAYKVAVDNVIGISRQLIDAYQSRPAASVPQLISN